MISRRDFLRALFYTAGGSLLAACAPQPPTPTPLPTNTPVPPTATLAPSPVAVATNTLAPTTAPSATATTAATATATATLTRVPPSPTPSEPYLSVARGTSPAAITRAAIDALGGIRKFVKPGNEVIVKPNICNASIPPQYATTTNPQVVAEIVKLCLEAGAKRVRVMDQPFEGTAEKAYVNSGIRAAVEQVGGQMEIMSDMKYTAVDFPATARVIKRWKVYQDVLKADVLINVPVAKTHNEAKLTLAMKGLMGVIQDRNQIHLAMDQRIADLSTVIKPTLNVIDAIAVVARNGPTHWDMSNVVVANTIIASQDIVSADAYATQTLFQLNPTEIGYIKLGSEMGLGRMDLDKLLIKQVTV